MCELMRSWLRGSLAEFHGVSLGWLWLVMGCLWSRKVYARWGMWCYGDYRLGKVVSELKRAWGSLKKA